MEKWVKGTLICFLFIAAFVATFIEEVSADAFHPIYQGTRALAMGNAFTAVADDEQAIFYNPAGLAGIEDFSWNIVALDAAISSDLLTGYSTFSSALDNPGISSVNTLMGKNIFVNAQGASTLVMPGFGFAFLYDYQFYLSMQNSAFPVGRLGVQNTYGVQLGVGKRIIKFPRKRGELRIGFAGKTMLRSGGYKDLTLTQLLTLSAGTITSNLTTTGVGYGLDFGVQSIYNVNKKFSLMAGAVYKDIGNTTFASPADAIQSNLTMGVAARLTSQDLTATFSSDYTHLLDTIDWRKKLNLGMELKMSLLSLSTGLSQLYPTFGAGIDFWLIKVMYATYAEDLSLLHGVNSQRSHLVHVALKFGL